MFTIDGLNDKQLGRIARNPQFMTDYNHMVSPTSPAGQNKEDWEFEMVNRLKKDATQFKTVLSKSILITDLIVYARSSSMLVKVVS